MTEICPICSTPMRRHLADWVRRCPSCGFRSSTLAIDREGIARGDTAIDEDARQEGLDAVRLENFEAILDVVDRHVTRGARLLDVGCAHGWFLQAAQRRGYEVFGVEPDAGVHARIAPALRSRVSLGYFPQDLGDSGPFDVIVFNDVFEHVPDVEAVLRACHERLSPRGLLVLNLPYASGVFYRVAELLARVGRPGPFDRMWQRRFPSPHLSYFEPETLKRLCEKHGFVEKDRRVLRTLRVRGLWARLSGRAITLRQHEPRS